MKNIILLIVFALISLSSFGQLNAEAEYLKENNPEYYQPIKEVAESEWPGDHSMVVYEINKRSKAFSKWTEYYFSQEEGSQERIIMLTAMIEWREPGYREDKLYFDWPMVIYEFEKQMKAANSY